VDNHHNLGDVFRGDGYLVSQFALSRLFNTINEFHQESTLGLFDRTPNSFTRVKVFESLNDAAHQPLSQRHKLYLPLLIEKLPHINKVLPGAIIERDGGVLEQCVEAVLQGPKASGDRVTEAVTHVQYATTIGDRESIAFIRYREY